MTSAKYYSPTSIAEIINIVQAARKEKFTIQIFSTGLNWGYGSKATLLGKHATVDLSKMRKILNADEISISNPVAVIEPGVTQGQLHEFLQQKCPSLYFNVTGSGRDTSIIGNALDRGVGYLGPRRDDLFGLELVTGTGDVLQTGFRRLGHSSPLASCHPFGLGPMLDGLFFQSNFGVITSACFRLLPRPACQVGVSLALSSEKNLGRFIDILAELKRERVMTGVTHIGNRARTRSSLMHGITDYLKVNCKLCGAALEKATKLALYTVAPHEWTSLGGISGTRKQVTAAVTELRSRMRGLGKINLITNEKLELGYKIFDRFRFLSWAQSQAAVISAVRPLHGLASGIPTDTAINNLLWKFGRTDLLPHQLDESNCGILYISPALPMVGDFVTTIVARMKSIALEHGHELYITLNIETETSMVAIINLLFDRSNNLEIESAQCCASALYAHIKSCGLEVYRARADMMHKVVDPTSDYWKYIRNVKSVFDPDNVIDPGRYNIL